MKPQFENVYVDTIYNDGEEPSTSEETQRVVKKYLKYIHDVQLLKQLKSMTKDLKKINKKLKYLTD